MSALKELIALYEDKSDYVIKNLGPKLEAAGKKDDPKKLDTAEKVVKELEKAGTKHLVWVARMYAAGHFKVEDVPRMKDELEKFEKNKKKLEKKDLNAYKNLEELYGVLDKLEPEEEQSEIDTKDKDAEFLIRSKNYMALIPKNAEASCKYGAGTRWCTAARGNNLFKSYNDRGELIIIIAKIDDKWRKFQFHFASNAFYNEKDVPATKDEIKALSKHPEHVKLIHILIDKYHPEDDE